MTDEEQIKELVIELQKLPLHLPAQSYNRKQLQTRIAEHLNHLIVTDFSLLISLLYRLDISESKLKHLLQNAKARTAGDIIAEMIIERQLQKISSRQMNKNDVPHIPDDEKW